MVDILDIAQGYQRTEVGVIPTDWVVNELGEILLSTQLGGNYPNNDINTGISLIKMGNLNRGYIDINKTYFIKNGVNPIPQDKIYYGDVLFNTRNTLDLVGKVAIWQDELPIAYFNSNIMRLVFKPEEVSSNFFMNYILNTRLSIYQLRGIATGTTSVAAIYTKDLVKIKVPLPPLDEQNIIADTIKDFNNEIQFLEKLIAKKRNIKQGVIQELLKPKSNWNLTTVESLGTTYGGLSGKSKKDFVNGTSFYIPFLNIMNNPVIDPTYFDYVKIEIGENQNKALKGDLFFNGSSETPEEVGMCSVLLTDISNLYLNSFCFGFRLNQELNNDGLYLAYFFRSCYGRKIFYSLAQGATRYNLSKGNFLKIEFLLPESNEQTNIAGTLLDMDSELNAFEKELEKKKMILQGMMQNLLTGKKRLI